MKKLVIFVFIAAMLVIGMPVFAQENHDEGGSAFYYVNITLEKIYPHKAGYAVQYRTGGRNFATAYLPIEWFANAGGKGEVIFLPKGYTWPSMSVYYKDGEFSHVRLYVHRWVSHQTWGVVPQNASAENFEGVEGITIEY